MRRASPLDWPKLCVRCLWPSSLAFSGVPTTLWRVLYALPLPYSSEYPHHASASKLADGAFLLPVAQDDGDHYAATVLLPDAGGPSRSATHASMPGHAHGTIDNGPKPWADPWAAAPHRERRLAGTFRRHPVAPGPGKLRVVTRLAPRCCR
ncbi:hypothetical protein C8R44DRAFT_861721 [Mycena epipterygia]|nr:hypothetical protein C8R44DRAFT_861721 [Mycena epipterygia]